MALMPLKLTMVLTVAYKSKGNPSSFYLEAAIYWRE